MDAQSENLRPESAIVLPNPSSPPQVEISMGGLSDFGRDFFADRTVIRSATRDALEFLDQQLGVLSPSDVADFPVRPTASLEDVPKTKPRLTQLSVRATHSEPWSPVSCPATPFSPIFRTWRQSYTHVRSIRMSSEGPLQLVEQNWTGRQFIIKSIPDCREGYLPREAAMLRRVLEPHDNVVRLEECFQEGNECHMVLEYCSGGDLENLCNFCYDRGQRLPGEFILHFVATMIEVLAFLHCGDVEFLPDHGGHSTDAVRTLPEQGAVLHRDIKPGNIFLRWERAKNSYGMPEIILGDFGRAALESESWDVHGTPGFVAPEVEEYWERAAADNMHRANEPICTRESDMYSFGATLYHLMTLEDYEQGDDIRKAWSKSTVKEWGFIPNLLESCLAFHPADRLQIETLYHIPKALKHSLQTWHENGGRMGMEIWPDPRWYENWLEEDQMDISRGSSSSQVSSDPSALSIDPTRVILTSSSSATGEETTDEEDSQAESIESLVLLNLFIDEDSQSPGESTSECMTPGILRYGGQTALHPLANPVTIGEYY